MSNYTKSGTKLPKPSQAFPKLVPHLAKISKLSFELYELTKPEVMGEALGMKKQSFQAHIDKLKKKI